MNGLIKIVEMSGKKKKDTVKPAKKEKTGKYDITVGLDVTFEQAIHHIAQSANKKLLAKNS